VTLVTCRVIDDVRLTMVVHPELTDNDVVDSCHDLVPGIVVP